MWRARFLHQLLVEDVLAAPDITPAQGSLSATAAARPGLGFELNWDAVERATVLYYRDESYRHS